MSDPTPPNAPESPRRRLGWRLLSVPLVLLATGLSALAGVLLTQALACALLVVSLGYPSMLVEVLTSWRTPLAAAITTLALLIWRLTPPAGARIATRPRRALRLLGLTLGIATPLAIGVGALPSPFEHEKLQYVEALEVLSFEPYDGGLYEEEHPHRPPIQVTLNRYGFRDHDWTDLPEEGVTRIALIGDSNVFGLGVDDEGLLDRLLEAELTRLDPGRRWEVLNLGVPGFGFLTYFTGAANAITHMGAQVAVVADMGFTDAEALDRSELRRRVGPAWFSVLGRFFVPALLAEFSTRWADRHHPVTGAPGIDFPGRERLFQRLRQLNQVGASEGAAVVDWSQDCWMSSKLAENLPLEHVTYTTWPEELCDYFERPGWTIPNDGHLTATANARVARDLAPLILRTLR